MLRRFAAFAALSLSLCAAAAEPPRNKALHDFFERAFQEEMRDNPELATLLGLDTGNDKLVDRSPTGTAKRKAVTKARIAELKRFEASALNRQDRLSRDMLLDDLERAAALDALYGDLPFGANEFDSWLVASPIGGVQEWFVAIAKAAPYRDTRDYENYVKRLEAMPRALEQLAGRMRAGLRSGWTPPSAVLSAVPAQFEDFSGSADASPLFLPFKEFPAAMAQPERERLAAAGRRVLTERVNPAWAAFRKFLESEYLPGARATLGASSLPEGGKYYAILASRSTTTDLTPRQIHDIGLAEVARIRAGMDKAIAAAAFKGSFAEFLQFLRTDPRFYFTKPEDMLMAYRDIAKRADAELPKLFAELPRLPYGIRPMEAYEGDNFDHYVPGAMDGSRAGFFEANTNNLAKRPRYDMEWTLLHEAVPGHHLQIARANELQDLPKFRRAGNYTAYGEGWALYSESLGYEMGFYKDPYSRFGALAGEMLRACRLVVDTGLHAFGWTREQAIRYLADNSGLHESAAIAEIDRYIVWPGQALGYKIGELKIKELRSRAEKALGPRFDIRRFHNALLDDGPLPLTVLERRIDEWIDQERKKKT